MKTFKNLFINSIIGIMIFAACGITPVFGALFMNGAGVLKSQLNLTGCLQAGLLKEIWLPDIMEQFWPDWSFLKEARDMSSFVDNNTINLAEAGISPNVLIDNTVFPVPFAERSDNPLALPLSTFDTEGTVLRNAELIQLAYDKRASVTTQHQKALLNKFSKKAAYAFCPSADNEFNPVLTATGDNFTYKGHTFKKLTFNDIVSLKIRYDLLDIPDDSRVIVLSPHHENQLWLEDSVLYKLIMQDTKVFGFKYYRYSQTPVFDGTTNLKKAFEAAAADTDQISSFSFVNTEAMRAQGIFDMFYRLNDPEQKGDIINFQMRGIALPIRNKFMGAIYSPITG